MAIINTNALALAAQNQARTQSQTTLLSSRNIIVPSRNIAADVAAQQERANAIATANSAVYKAQIDESNLSQTSDVLDRMSNLLNQAATGTFSETDLNAINEELTKTKAYLQTTAGTASGDALNKSYATTSGNSYHVLGSAAGQGSRELSVSASTTAADYKDMLSAIGSMKNDVATARSAAGATMIAAQQQSVDKSGLGTQVIADGDISEAVARAEAARKEMEATRLNLSNMFSNSNHAAIFALLQ